MEHGEASAQMKNIKEVVIDDTPKYDSFFTTQSDSPEEFSCVYPKLFYFLAGLETG